MATNNRVAEASVAYFDPQVDEVEQELLCPPGYNQTEVGVIPEDWIVSTIGKTGYVTLELTSNQ